MLTVTIRPSEVMPSVVIPSAEVLPLVVPTYLEV